MSQDDLAPRGMAIGVENQALVAKSHKELWYATWGVCERALYRGILTGLNDAFVVSREDRDRLIEEHPSSGQDLKAVS